MWGWQQAGKGEGRHLGLELGSGVVMVGGINAVRLGVNKWGGAGTGRTGGKRFTHNVKQVWQMLGTAGGHGRERE